jgi:ABC-type Fe3+-hydroxamate transport system substrate-binding protein
MKSIKLVSIVLATALMASVLCACASNKDSNNGGDKNTPATTAAAAGDSNAQATDNRVIVSGEGNKIVFTIDSSFKLKPNSWLGIVPAGRDYKTEGEADEVDLIWINPDTYEEGQTTPFKFTYDNEDLARIGNGEYIMVLCENDDDPDSKVFLYFPVKITGIIITADLSKLVIN